MNLYCTCFDHRYLDRGLAMIRSLRSVDPDAGVTVLCLSDACAEALSRIGEPRVELWRLADFERDNPDLLAIKDERSLRDYYFTLSGCLVDAVLRDQPEGGIATYLDADLFFYASPAPLFAAMADASVGLIGHRFHWWAKRLEKYGRFNAGWASFRADAIGRQAARWWRDSCIDWCFGTVDTDHDRFADQKYLDHIFARFSRVVEIAHPGANIGPWNICRHRIARGPGEGFTADGLPLIFVHYSGLQEVAPDVWHCSNVSYLGPFSRTVREGLYRPYLARLKQIRAALGGLPAEAVPDIRGLPPPRRRRLAPLLRVAGHLAGHYIALS